MSFLKVAKIVLYWVSMVAPLIDAVKGIKKGYKDGKANDVWIKNNKDKVAFFESWEDEVEEEGYK